MRSVTARQRRLVRSTVHAVCETLDRRLLLAAGDPDTAFSGDGRTAFNFPGAAFVVIDTAVAPNGQIVAGGTKGTNMALARLNVDGTVDTSFGTGGLFESNRRESLTSVAIQGDGKIIIGLGREDGLEHNDLTIGRILASGAGFDPTFGSTGIAFAGHNRFNSSSVNDVAVQRDGSIIGAGYVDHALVFEEYDFTVVRYDANGTLDPTFAGDGVSVHGFGNTFEEITAVTIDYNFDPISNPLYGTIVAVGGDAVTPGRFQVLRLRANGTADTAFDGDGKLTSPDLSGAGTEFARDVVVQPGGKVVVAGEAISTGNPNLRNFLVSRYSDTGALDDSFGLGGNGVTELDLGGNDQVGGIAIGYHNTLGNLVVAGSKDNTFAAIALRPNGQLDTRFSGDGILTTNILGHATGLLATGNLFPPARKLVFAGGNGQVARFIDVGSVISVGTFQPNMYEQGTQSTAFVVGRTEILPFTERIFIGTGGVATPPNTFPVRPRDYNGTTTPPGLISFGNGQTSSTYVDILANTSFTTVTITPVDDTTVEGDEPAVFSVGNNIAYDASTTFSTNLMLRDNDTTGGPTVAASEFVYQTGPQRVTFRFTQDVANSISASDFQITGAAGIPAHSMTYDAVTNTATLSFPTRLPDGNLTARVVGAGVTNPAGTPMAADSLFAFFFLNGDANRDGAVNLDDFNILATNFNTFGKTFSQGNFDYDPAGNVNLDDFNILASRFGVVLVAPSMAVGGGLKGPASPFGGGRIVGPKDDPLSELLV